MFNSTMPLPIFFLFVIILIVFFTKNLSKKKPVRRELPHIDHPVVDHSVYNDLKAKFCGWNMEEMEIFVYGFDRTNITFKLKPGDKVSLSIVDGHKHILVPGLDLGTFLPDSGHLLPSDVLSERMQYKAFIGDRVEYGGSEFWCDTLNIVVFWKSI